MRHSWLVLATLLVCVGEADAKRVSCTCPSVITVPERGATDVPINAKLWSFGSPGPHTYTATDGAVIPNVQTEAPALQPNAPYRSKDWMTEFTTSGESDEVVPGTPTLLYASVVTLVDGTVEALSITGQLPNDAALVRIDIRDATGAVARVMTTPKRLFLCQPQLRVAPGKVSVEIRALDLAGNQSASAAMNITTTTLLNSDPDLDCRFGGSRYDHRHRGHGFEILFVLTLYPLGLIAWLVLIVIRRATVKRELPEPVSLLAAEAVVRRLMRWQIVWTAMLIAATIAVTSELDEQYWIFLSPWLVSTIGQLFMQHRALRLLDRPEVDAARRGPWLVVTSLKSSVTVRASDIDFVVGKRRAIPTSIVQ